MRQTRVADGTRIAYRTLGPRDGPPLVLLDGLSCAGFVFRDLEPRLAERFRVLHLHYRGHGRSGLPRDPGACTLPHLAADVAELLEHDALEPAVLVAHSMGVQVALEVALRSPGRVRALVLMCGAPGRVLDTFRHTDLGRRLLPWIDLGTRTWREPIARALRAVLPSGLAYAVAVASEIKGDRVAQADLMPYLEHFARMPLDLFTAMLTDAAERTSEAWLGRVGAPALVIAAEDDGFTPVARSRDLATALPHAELEVIARASHLGPLERPDAFWAALSAFVDAHGLALPPAARPTTAASLAERWRHARSVAD